MWDTLLLLLKIMPDIIIYPIVFAFIGYVIDPNDRNSGLWYSDVLSTLGIVAGAVFAVGINL
jgi:hypothetical protein